MKTCNGDVKTGSGRSEKVTVCGRPMRVHRHDDLGEKPKGQWWYCERCDGKCQACSAAEVASG